MVIFWNQVFKTSGASQSFHTSYFFVFICVPAFLQEVLSKICGFHCSGLSQKHSINYAESASSPMRKSMTMDQRKRKSFSRCLSARLTCTGGFPKTIRQDYMLLHQRCPMRREVGGSPWMSLCWIVCSSAAAPSDEPCAVCSVHASLYCAARFRQRGAEQIVASWFHSVRLRDISLGSMSWLRFVPAF